MEQLQFKVSSAIKDLIGKDLIVDENIAVFELVKNSYDAYASKVVIEFDQDRITISDNGKGMTLSDIEEKWLFLGYSAKKDGSEDKDVSKQTSYRDKIKRHFAGAKGIGRFSCDRLGSNLKLTTKSELSKTTETIYVDWRHFEVDQSSKFTDIFIDRESDVKLPEFPKNSKSGTIIEISCLHNGSFWDRKRILKLKHLLEKLINPFSETNDFEIEIICLQEKEQDNIARENKALEKDIVNGIIKNTISEVLSLKTTQIEVALRNNSIITRIIDRGETIYEIQESNRKFDKLRDVSINIYYLNRAAKYNFNKLMGVQPVQYGSIFLFRNGFRILPFGNSMDDSWGLDYRAQQGYNRSLGTRDLFGRVDITTDNIDDLKEVSSRDGGLIETPTSAQLFGLFKVAHRRLERYVVGVLWGEAFLKKDYFENKSEALKERANLLENDKDSDTPAYVLDSSIGSKIDFIQLIKTLTQDKDIEVLYYNKDLANIVSDPMETWRVKPQFISDLERIAVQTDDSNLLLSIDEAKARIVELQKAKEDAEKRAFDLEQERLGAEQKAKEEEERRKEAEKRQKEEEKARAQAELRAKEAEKRRNEEEIARVDAELKAQEAQRKRKEEEIARVNAEIKAKDSEIKRQSEELKRKNEEVLRHRAESERDVEKSKNKYLLASRNITKETADILHTIKISSTMLTAAAKYIQYALEENDINQIREKLDVIYFHIERVNNLSKLLTKADITLLKEHSKVDIARYTKEYVENYKATIKDISVKILYNDSLIRKLPLLDLTVIIDNLISNSVKADATKIYIEFRSQENKIVMDFADNGKGVDLDKNTHESIFELGVTNRRGGSGIGLSTIRDIMRKEVKGEIKFIGNSLHFESGATFRLIF